MTEEERKQQLVNLQNALDEMREYLQKLEKGCMALPMGAHSNNKELLDKLFQIMEGMDYYQKLLKSAAVLLEINFSEPLYGQTSIASFDDELAGIFENICNAAESEDYSLVSDLTEYDLVPAIQTAQVLMTPLQERSKERVN